MRLLDKLLRRLRDRDRRLQSALIEQRLKGQKRGAGERHDAEDYPSRGGVFGGPV